MNRYLFLIILLQTISSLAQNEANIWYFGQNAGLDFNGGVPVPIDDGQLNTNEGCSSISDENGDLLFYSDGITVWDRNHLPMPNGSNLLGSPSATQSGLIVPLPNSTTIYYIFTLDNVANDNGLRYSVIDMSLNNGLGDVTNEKNILLITPIKESITAVNQANGNDVWVVTHGMFNDEFYSFSITDLGIDTNPVVSAIGHTPTNNLEAIGGIKLSPNGSKIAIGYANSAIFELGNFDISTGRVSEIITFDRFATSPVPNNYAYAFEFSPNNKLLYLNNNNLGLFQYSIQNFTETEILNTEVPISLNLSLGPGSGLFYGQLQLGPDGRIYSAISARSSLSVINNPNEVGMLCDFQLDAVRLAPGTQSNQGLPPFITTYFFTTINVENVCVGDSTLISLNTQRDALQVEWDFGDGSTGTGVDVSHSYSQEGNYVITAEVFINSQTFTFSRTISVGTTPTATTPPDIEACDDNGSGLALFDLTSNDSFILNGQDPNAHRITYYENRSDLDNGLSIIEPDLFMNTQAQTTQRIFARVQNTMGDSQCTQTTSFEIKVRQSPETGMIEPITLCPDESIQLTVSSSFDRIEWSNGSRGPSIEVNEPGSYTAVVINDYNTISCNTEVTYEVIEPELVDSFEVLVENWSINNNSIEVVIPDQDDYEFAVNFGPFQDSPIFENLRAGVYEVLVRSKYDCAELSQLVNVSTFPGFFTPNDDGYNDIWNVNNPNPDEDLQIFIFDRYGKFLVEINSNGIGWDGNLNGQPLPASDYWFRTVLTSGREYRGHFTLKR
ncbi:hypothetical protein BST97_14365 [Nonlabens spongiae]|uniref:PKD domain-containing protein n=1 Tax=Nonlabens spongiae TaxID=331648 RepID=A0A1W6MNA8_9FLAO|nr:T9SS type B sorting domain-containing protein [Nonlabens spongiae]ARN79078.1 hypothetical protein BST97_14365 [Nonlabens spongiae]